MTTSDENPQDLGVEAAEAILATIRDLVPRLSSGEQIHHLADAYAAVMDARPRGSGRARGIVM